MRPVLIAAIAGLLTGPIWGALTPLWMVKAMPEDRELKES